MFCYLNLPIMKNKKLYCNSLFLFFCIIFFFISTIPLFSYPKKDIDTIVSYLKRNWSYYNEDGKRVKVKRLERKVRKSNHKLFVNGKQINPSLLYNEKGQNLLKPWLRNSKIQYKQSTGPEPNALKGITNAHNFYRKKAPVALPNLIWDSKIATYAQKWAIFLKKKYGCKMKHRSHLGKNTKKYGENLAWSRSIRMLPIDVVKAWYNEIQNYNYQKNSCNGVCGHYTQLVWKTSLRVGCGISRCGLDEVWVCNYDPPGNWRGQRPY